MYLFKINFFQSQGVKEVLAQIANIFTQIVKQNFVHTRFSSTITLVLSMGNKA